MIWHRAGCLCREIWEMTHLREVEGADAAIGPFGVAQAVWSRLENGAEGEDHRYVG